MSNRGWWVGWWLGGWLVFAETKDQQGLINKKGKSKGRQVDSNISQSVLVCHCHSSSFSQLVLVSWRLMSSFKIEQTEYSNQSKYLSEGGREAGREAGSENRRYRARIARVELKIKTEKIFYSYDF